MPSQGKHPFRVEKDYLELAQEILRLRESRGTRNEVLREAIETGLPILAALAMSDQSDTYGEHSAQSLARKLRPQVAALLEFLVRHGELPLAMSSGAAGSATPLLMRDRAQEPPAFIQPVEAQDLLDVFGGLA